MDTIDEELEVIESLDGSSTPQQLPSVALGEGGGSTGAGTSTIIQSKKRGRARSAPCWISNFFTEIDPKDSMDGKRRAKCTKCLREFVADPSKNGTTSLNNHMKKCPNRENKDISQMLLGKSDGKMSLKDLNIDRQVVKDMVLNLIVKHELPLRFVEYEEFRLLMSYVYQDYTVISRGTLLNDIQKVFRKEKMIIKEAIKNSCGRISVTTDLWTSISNDGYMTLTAHYIDRSWVLHKRLIKFTVLTPPHTGKHIADAISKILNEWGIEGRLFSVTVDNASANDVFVASLQSNLRDKNALLCNGEFFHIRCCAHILNLIVQDGLKLIDTSVQKARDSVKFVKSSQARKVRFVESCENTGMSTKRGLHADVSTRWNSTFQMLSDALYYRQGFEELKSMDLNYTACPSYDEWAKIGKLTKILQPFDEITKLLSGSKYPTANLYFRSVVEVHTVLNDGLLFGGDFMKDMVFSMREKFNKYWENYSLILSVAAVLDPRYKLKLIEWAYDQIHHKDSFLIDKAIGRVKSALCRLYGEYKSMPKEGWSSTREVQDDSNGVAQKEDRFASWANESDANMSGKSELDRYLEEQRKPVAKDFDVLAYWKTCAAQYPDLSRLACDVLAIPVSTVASESAFSVGGRVIDKYRSKLLPKNVEALVCLRDWMYDMNFGDEKDPDQDVEDLSEALSNVFSFPPKSTVTTATTSNN